MAYEELASLKQESTFQRLPFNFRSVVLRSNSRNDCNVSTFAHPDGMLTGALQCMNLVVGCHIGWNRRRVVSCICAVMSIDVILDL